MFVESIRKLGMPEEVRRGGRLSIEEGVRRFEEGKATKTTMIADKPKTIHVVSLGGQFILSISSMIAVDGKRFRKIVGPLMDAALTQKVRGRLVLKEKRTKEAVAVGAPLHMLKSSHEDRVGFLKRVSRTKSGLFEVLLVPKGNWNVCVVPYSSFKDGGLASTRMELLKPGYKFEKMLVLGSMYELGFNIIGSMYELDHSDHVSTSVMIRNIPNEIDTFYRLHTVNGVFQDPELSEMMVWSQREWAESRADRERWMVMIRGGEEVAIHDFNFSFPSDNAAGENPLKDKTIEAKSVEKSNSKGHFPSDMSLGKHFSPATCPLGKILPPSGGDQIPVDQQIRGPTYRWGIVAGNFCHRAINPINFS
ncbi:hypothetical protein Tco_0309199 [Tanacetum coccineum]